MNRTPIAVLAVGSLALGAFGCARLDMVRAYDPQRPATTIAYTGVREETRLYGDYGGLGAGILTEEDEKKPAGKGKKKGQ